MGTSGSKLHRSTAGDVKDNLIWSIEELQRWEDGAAMVKDLLATDISEASEALAAVGVPIEKAADAPEAGVPAEAAAPTATPPTAGATSAPGAVSESEAQRAQASGKGVGVEFDAAMTRHLLHSVDEVLRRGESQDYFKNVPQEKLEQMMTNPSSWFVLPPRVNGGPQLSSSRVFALAAVAAVLDRTHKGRTGVDYPSGSEEARLAHKRSQGELYESRTPYSSPAPASAAEAERLRLRAEAEAQPSGSLEAQREASLQAPSSHVQRADVPYEHGAAVSSGGEEAKGQAGAPQVPSPSLHSVDNQRKVVVAKYLSAMRLSQLKKLCRPGSKTWESLPAVKKLRFENLAADSHQRLDRALVAFDRARLALTWLLRNYELSLATYKTNATIASLKHIHNRLQNQSVAHSPLAASIRSSQMSEAQMQLHFFDRRHLQLLLEMQANERDSLNCGLYMLDKNLTGTLTSNELPTLPVKLFQLLDVRHKNEINASDMQQCIYNLCKSLDSNQTRLYTLMAENARLGVAPSDANELIFEKNKMEITKIRSLIDEEKIALSSIYSVFHSSLVDHLFAKQSSALQRVDVADIDMATLHGQLEEVERRAAINPIEEELHLGMRGIDIVRLAGGGRAKEAPAPTAGPTPKETLLGETRGAMPEERERKTVGYEQPSAAGWKKEGREIGEEKIPSKDESALEGGGRVQSEPTAGGKMLAAAGALPVHSESSGVPTLSTTDEETGVGGMTERLKRTWLGSKDESAPMGGTAEEGQMQSAAGERTSTEASAPSQEGHEHSSIGEKLKNAFGIGQ